MAARNDLGIQRRWRLRTSYLWILAAALGAASIFTAASIVHDTTQHREAARLVLRATAVHIAALAAGRLEVLALQTLAPAGSPSVITLARAHRDAARCGCRETLPASEIFRVDLARETVERAPAGNAPPAVAPGAALLIEIARAEAARGPAAPPIHLVVDPRLNDQFAVTMVARNDSGRAIAMYGVTAKVRRLGDAIFGAGLDTSFGLARLDSLSLQVATPQGVIVYGRLRTDAQLRISTHPRGPLEGVTIAIALWHGQVPAALIALTQQTQLWHLGFLQLCTILVIVMAVGSSRRELLLARARSDFIAGVSHDLRMPLAQILLAGETLTMRRERDENERLAFTGSIVREARRLITLVENVLLFSRSGAVELKAHLVPLAVDDLFRDVTESVQLAVDDAGQHVDVEPAPALALLGDRALLRQALVNLLDNAIKYGPRDQHIRLSAEQSSPATVRLYVDDHGPGIPASERAGVFEPYERLARDQTSERTGTGLGLAVVRAIATACQARVWLDDAPGGGTRAVLELQSAALAGVAPLATHAT
ncbi:MAG: HAMP domain-containing sensor histidine kinase [Gemmatimonadaceae bacterium]